MESTECNIQKHQDAGCPVVMTHASTAGGMDSIPAWESHMPQGATQKQEKKKNIKLLCYTPETNIRL